MSEASHQGWWKMCAHCGERLGIYEPILVRLCDGRIERSSFLNLPAPLRSELSACFHEGCLPLDQGETPL